MVKWIGNTDWVDIDSTHGTQAAAVWTFVGISTYLSAEVTLRVFTTFKRYRGLYFWSLLVSAITIFLLPIIDLADWYTGWFSDGVGGTVTDEMLFMGTWVCRLVAQHTVLYSRLYLVLLTKRHRAWVLGVIVGYNILFTVPWCIVSWVHDFHPALPNLTRFYYYWERITLVLYSVIEYTMVAIYVWKARELCRTSSLLRASTSNRNRRTFVNLVALSTFILLVDIAGLTVWMAHYTEVSYYFLNMANAMKVRMELSLLMDLVDGLKGDTSSEQYEGQGGSSGGRLSWRKKAPGSAWSMRETEWLKTPAEEEQHELVEWVGATEVDGQGGNFCISPVPPAFRANRENSTKDL